MKRFVLIAKLSVFGKDICGCVAEFEWLGIGYIRGVDYIYILRKRGGLCLSQGYVKLQGNGSVVRNDDTCIKMECLVNKFDFYVCRLGQKVDWFSIKYYSISLMFFFGFESKKNISFKIS